jgi:hypothetical protein
VPKISSIRCQDALAITALLAIIGALFYALPSGYWRADDPAILLHAMRSKGLSAFFDPVDWHKLSVSNLTPWLTLSFKFDLWAAGLSPKFFYLHSMASLGLVAAAAYALNRLWLVPIWSFLSVALFLVGAPTASVTELLMTRHYLEGLLFALLSVIAFVRATRRQSLPWALLGAMAYAFAATAKEIYVPLVLVVPLIPPVGRFASRLRLVAPYIAVAALYVLWRQYMLSGMVGGYADTPSVLSMQSASGMLVALGQFPGYLFGSGWRLPTALIAGALVIAARKKPGAVPAFAVLALAVVMPLIPLVNFPGITGPDRYLFLVWFVVSFVSLLAIQTASAVGRRSAPIIGIALGLLLLAMAFSHALEVRRANRAHFQGFDVQGRFYFEANHRQGFVPTSTLLHGYWYVTNLCDIKKELGLECPSAVIRGVPLDQAPDRLWAYDPGPEAMVVTPGNISDAVARVVGMDTTRPLSARVSIGGGVGKWALGPHADGQYYFASPMIGRYPVPKEGQLKTPLTALAFYVQYESPEGWSTTSPLLNASTDTALTWAR